MVKGIVYKENTCFGVSESFGNFEWSKKKFLGEVWWTIDFQKVLSILQKEKITYFSTGYSRYILVLQDLWECNVHCVRSTEKKTIQQHHMASSKHTRPIPVIKIAWVTDEENTLQKRYRQDGMKLFPQKAVQKDHQIVMRNPTKLLIHNGLERIEKWKELLNMWLKKHFIESGKKL